MRYLTTTDLSVSSCSSVQILDPHHPPLQPKTLFSLIDRVLPHFVNTGYHWDSSVRYHSVRGTRYDTWKVESRVKTQSPITMPLISLFQQTSPTNQPASTMVVSSGSAQPTTSPSSHTIMGEGFLLLVVLVLGSWTVEAAVRYEGREAWSRSFFWGGGAGRHRQQQDRWSASSSIHGNVLGTSIDESTLSRVIQDLRGGYDGTDGGDQNDLLSEKVRKAMIKLGLSPPEEEHHDEAANHLAASSSTAATAASATDIDESCQGGVCELPPRPDHDEEPAVREESVTPAVESFGQAVEESASAGTGPPPTTAIQESVQIEYDDEDQAPIIAARLATELQVDESLCMAALGATATISDDGRRRKFHEGKARELLQQELQRIQTVGAESPEVQQLVSEGHDAFLSRRALAFAEGDLDDARAILHADQMDEEAEQQQQEELQSPNLSAPPEILKTVEVKTNFDPTQVQAEPPGAPVSSSSSSTGTPPPAKKSDVVFDATAAQIQQLVLESPVPVLLDIYADWCGPCKVLGPALEEMAVKSGGAFRLVKVNTDNERAVSAALGVTALPTVFGVRNGKILHSFQGMPRSETMMRSFMMGLLVSESSFDPPVTADEKQQYAYLTSKLVKMAGSACFPFSARERLQDRIVARLDDLAEEAADFVEAEESALVLKSLFSNIVREPSSLKFRTVNLANKVLASKVARFAPSVAVLKSVGFVPDERNEETLTLGKGKAVVNVAPLMIARECIEKWIDKSRYEVAKAARKRRDEEERAKLQLNRNDEDSEYDEEDQDEDDVRDPNACTIKVRFDGKNKIHELELNADAPLSSVIEELGIQDRDDVQITCVAKRLVVSNTDQDSMSKSLRSLGLFPSSYLVLRLGDSGGTKTAKDAATSSLARRANTKLKRKKGSHTMQSVGIYAKDDNNKAELIDGGGGVWYEHDVTDDEEITTEKEGGDADDVAAVEEDSIQGSESEPEPADDFTDEESDSSSDE